MRTLIWGRSQEVPKGRERGREGGREGGREEVRILHV